MNWDYEAKGLNQYDLYEGLVFLTCDRQARADEKLTTQTQPGIWLGLLISGAWQTQNSRGVFDFISDGRPNLVTMGAPTECIEGPLSNGRLALSSIFVTKEFLKRAVQDDPSGRFKTLLRQSRGGFERYDLGHCAAIASALRQLKDNPYHGNLAHLYTEQHAMAALFDLASSVEQGRDFADPRLRLQTLAHDAREMITEAPEAYRSVSVMAEHLGTNPTTLRRAFHDTFGKPIFEYVCERRMGLARDLLLDTQLQVAQIAYRVGYSSPSNFTTAYRRRYGLSPARDRSRAQIA